MVEATAFCPSHITGFFKAHLADNHDRGIVESGSMGAGFSIKHGVTTRVKIMDCKNDNRHQIPPYRIRISKYQTDKTDVSEFVLNEFLNLDQSLKNKFIDIEHEISIPVGYGLGSSSAVALSLSLALDQALKTKLERTTIGQIAHKAEINCKTGLGDVLASFHGGFEIRTKPGAPGIGSIKKISTDKICIIMACFSPISTNKFILEKLSQINGIGGQMVDKLLESKNYEHFQDLSLEFAKHVNVMTPRMQTLVDELSKNNIKCGIALFGETVFSMIPLHDEDKVLKILQKYSDCILIKSELDNIGARIIN